MNNFVHLHTHSYYSFLDEIASPEELVLAAKKPGFKALALQNMTPSTEFELHKKERIRFCGWLVTSRRVPASNNQYMKFLTLEDQFGLCEAVLFPAVYAKYGHLIRTHGPYIVSGRVQSRLPGEANLIVEKLELVEMNKQEIESLLQKKQVKMYESVQQSAISGQPQVY